jgi:hypothetical protein
MHASSCGESGGACRTRLSWSGSAFPADEAARRDPLAATGADHVVMTLSDAIEALATRSVEEIDDRSPRSLRAVES